MTTTLVCETGAQLPNANSYANLAYATSYFANNTDWAGTTDDLTNALAVAFQSLELLYGPRYLGVMLPTSLQVALFPRLPFTDNNGRLIRSNVIPDFLLRAQCEIALLSLNGTDVFPIRSTDQNVARKTTKLDVLTTDVHYVKPVEGESFKGFRKVDLILAPILKTSGAVSYRVGL
jgi:hypothetical protein